MLKLFNFEGAERCYKENHDCIEKRWYESQKIHYMKKVLPQMLKSFRFAEAEDCYKAIKRHIDNNWYKNLRGYYKKKELHDLLILYNFEEAEFYYKKNRGDIEKNWFRDLRSQYKKQELTEILTSYKFIEAEKYYNQNRKYISKSWYENKKFHYKSQQDLDRLTNKASDELEILETQLLQLRQFQTNGVNRTVWNQNYSQRKNDEELIATAEKNRLNINIIRNSLLSANRDPVIWDSFIQKQEMELDVIDLYVKKLKENLEAKMKIEKVSQELLKEPWEKIHFWDDRIKSDLGKYDKLLIQNWTSQNGGEIFNKIAMTSARKAELAALRLYRQLYGSAEDLSIMQVTDPNRNEWKKADISTNDQWIDVKNARTSFSSPNTYSEHCVPKFKSDRKGHDVTISAFLSPYGEDSTDPIIWLGETTWGQIEQLQKYFNSDTLAVNFSTDLNKNFLPAWLFDYPAVCYRERDASLEIIRSPDFEFPRRECAIGSGVLAKRVIASKTESALGSEAMRLERRINDCGLSRPVLFLHILDRFCRLTSEHSTFKETRIDEILFPGSGEHSKIPLGVYDPLKTVWNLWNILSEVSERCFEEATYFNFFKLGGANILQGRKDHGKWVTIYAYCGGWGQLEDKTPIRCGQNPLYLGQDQTCSSCNKLICHECGFCSNFMSRLPGTTKEKTPLKEKGI